MTTPKWVHNRIQPIAVRDEMSDALDLLAKANDNAVLHLTGDQTATGTKSLDRIRTALGPKIDVTHPIYGGHFDGINPDTAAWAAAAAAVPATGGTLLLPPGTPTVLGVVTVPHSNITVEIGDFATVKPDGAPAQFFYVAAMQPANFRLRLLGTIDGNNAAGCALYAIRNTGVSVEFGPLSRLQNFTDSALKFRNDADVHLVGQGLITNCVQNGVEFSFTTADNDGLGNPGPIAIPAYIGYYIDDLIVDTVTDPSFLQGQGVYFELGTGSATNPVRHVRIGSLSVFNAVRGLHFESAVAGWFTEDVAIGTLIADGCSVEGWGMIRVRHWAAGEVVVRNTGTAAGLTSTGRADACGTTNGSPVVTDAAIGAGDAGVPLTGPNVPAGSYVGTVTPGVSFRLSSSPVAQVDVNATATGAVTLAIGVGVGCVNITSNSTAWSIGSLTIEDDRASTADYATQGLRLNTVSDGVIAAAVINAGTAAAVDITAVTGEAIIAAMVLRGVATPAAAVGFNVNGNSNTGNIRIGGMNVAGFTTSTAGTANLTNYRGTLPGVGTRVDALLFPTSGSNIRSELNSGEVGANGGKSFTDAGADGGAWLRLFGNSHATNPGRLEIRVGNISNANNQFDVQVGGNDALQVDRTGSVRARKQLYPGAEGAGIQTSGGLLHAAAVPSNANGNNNDWCLSDNGHLYFKSAGAWAQVV